MSSNFKKRSLANFISGRCVVRPSDGLRSRLIRAKGSRDFRSRARRLCPVITVGRLMGSTIVIYSLFSKSDGSDDLDRPYCALGALVLTIAMLCEPSYAPV